MPSQSTHLAIHPEHLAAHAADPGAQREQTSKSPGTRLGVRGCND